jgi:two-component system invasion response regulator UvrY
MYVVGLMYQSDSVATSVKHALRAVPNVDVQVLVPPSGHLKAGHLDILVTDCAEADLRLDRQAEPPPADVVLVVSEPILDGTAAFGDARPDRQRIPSMLWAIVRATILNSQPRPPTAANEQVLSKRERQVLRSIGEGFTHDQTARRLGISPHTVDTYVKRVRGKLRIGNKAELARAALMYT